MGFDPNTATVSATDDVPAITRARGEGRESKYANNPFRTPVRESFESGKVDEKGKFQRGDAKEIKVKAADALTASYWLRNAGEQENIGVALVFVWKDPETGEQVHSRDYSDLKAAMVDAGHGRKQVTIKFYGKPRKVKRASDGTETVAEENPLPAEPEQNDAENANEGVPADDYDTENWH